MPTARSIREHELDELLTLYQMLNPDDPELHRGEELHDQWQEMLCDESVEIVVVEHDDRLVASCVLSIVPNLTRNARTPAHSQATVEEAKEFAVSVRRVIDDGQLEFL